MEATAGLNSGASANVDASLTLNALEFPFTLDLPDPAAIIDSACGFINEHNPTADICAPVIECTNKFIDDTCTGLGEAWSELTLSFELGTISLLQEQELW